MIGAKSGFDKLAPWYHALEWLAFGRKLEHARFAFLERLSGSRDILLLGEGDGRCVERLAMLAPEARITCVDSSRGMIERASRRLAGSAAWGRVTFECADALLYAPEAGRFDAVATLFFLDCFSSPEVSAIVNRLDGALRPGAVWLFADFVLPKPGWARLRARVWIRVLYALFRITTGLRVSALPPSEEILARAGWSRTAAREFDWGLIRSAVFLKGTGWRGPVHNPPAGLGRASDEASRRFCRKKSSMRRQP
jgi:ubiquinone/menaquinone biosynthesis C-methylase UbiE